MPQVGTNTKYKITMLSYMVMKLNPYGTDQKAKRNFTEALKMKQRNKMQTKSKR